MPPLTRWFVKTSLVYFVLALVTGLLRTMTAIWKLPFPTGGLFPIYIHLLAEGWITLLIMGVIFWMFPKYSREKPHGSEMLGWLSYWLVNSGLLLRIISETASAQQPFTVWGWLLVLSAAIQWAGGMAFVLNTWGRVKEK